MFCQSIKKFSPSKPGNGMPRPSNPPLQHAVMPNNLVQALILPAVRYFSRVSPPPPAYAAPVIRVSNNVARLGSPKEGPKPRQLLSLPPFPAIANPLVGRNTGSSPGQAARVTAISWVKHYFADIPGSVIQSHFNKGLVQVECSDLDTLSEIDGPHIQCLRKISCNEAMTAGMKIYVPVSVAETGISKRYDTIPSATLYPNADEIEYLQRLVMYKDSAIMVLNKPPKLPVKGNLPVHNSMDALAAAALSYGYEEGPKLVHKLDRESSGILLMGRTKESIARLHLLFSNINKAKTSFERYWALVIGSPKEKQGVICAPLSKVLLDDGQAERIILAHSSGIDGSQEAITEYRVLGPTINGCSWLELCPRTGRKHQLRVHCAEALGTPIVGDYKYGWFVHRRWKQMPRADYEPVTGKPYKLRRPEGLAVQKGSVLSKVPLLHLHCRELVLPNIAKFLQNLALHEHDRGQLKPNSKPDVLRFVAPMPSHMKISWNLMSSYLV
ncbi:RNA pseudouridine synthase 3, mitochondrial isoform X2 [Magnolia sinica]|uniref:RNA pseudouridine synthase 3, mitochondrial isoform X2 n=1 Tax=Magnolia sinica TaxID=86752 RepID=UPI002658F92D|nr:RNA pseudouridine synthase 3, mitochondrial isoform X2 [Magnolia sinica]